MGISGLLKALSSIQKKKHISEYSGQTVAIDAYVWLHKAIYSCQNDFMKDKETNKFVGYFLKKISLLTSNKIKPILVFDGDKLPNKAETEKKRESLRQNNLKKYEELHEKGLDEEAKKKYLNSIDVTPKMAYKVIKEIKRINIEYYVAPYEADAQIGYLSKIKHISFAISEDSDLLAYGCETVFYKMDNEGFGYEICLKDLPKCKDLDFKLFSNDMFLNTCILAGCDYLESINGIAFKKAHKLISDHKEVSYVVNTLRKNKYEVPSDYEDKFDIAFLTFKFQTIYCPLDSKFRHFNVINQETIYTKIHNYKDINFLGKVINDQEVSNSIVFGLIDPVSLEPYEEKLQINKFTLRNRNRDMFDSTKKKKLLQISGKKTNQLTIENFTKNDYFNGNKRNATQVDEFSVHIGKSPKINLFKNSTVLFSKSKNNHNINVNFNYIESNNNFIHEEEKIYNNKKNIINNIHIAKFLELSNKSLRSNTVSKGKSHIKLNFTNYTFDDDDRVSKICRSKEKKNKENIKEKLQQKHKLIKKVELIPNNNVKIDKLFQINKVALKRSISNI